MGTPIEDFPIAVTPVSGLNPFSGPPAAGDYFPAVRLADEGQAPSGSLARVNWAQMMTSLPMTGQPAIAGGAVTTALSPLAITQTWNNALVAFPGLTFAVTDTASLSTSKLWNLIINSVSVFSVQKDGSLAVAGNLVITGTSAFTGLVTAADITVSDQATIATTGKTGGAAVQDATTSSSISFAPKGLGIRAFVGADKAGVQVSGSADGDAFLMSTGGQVLLSGASGGAGLRLDLLNNVHVAFGGILSSWPIGSGIGYEAGAGGQVVQAVSATTAVALNKMSGQITTVAQNLGALAMVSFTVNNSNVLANDIILCTLLSGNTVPGTIVRARGVSAATSFIIDVISPNNTETGVLVIEFAIFRSAKT